MAAPPDEGSDGASSGEEVDMLRCCQVRMNAEERRQQRKSERRRDQQWCGLRAPNPMYNPVSRTPSSSPLGRASLPDTRATQDCCTQTPGLAGRNLGLIARMVFGPIAEKNQLARYLCRSRTARCRHGPLCQKRSERLPEKTAAIETEKSRHRYPLSLRTSGSSAAGKHKRAVVGSVSPSRAVSSPGDEERCHYRGDAW